MTVEVSEIQEGDILILRLDGRLDAASSPLLESNINTHLMGGAQKLMLNFEKVEYLSSAGMRLLLVLSKKLKGEQGKLVLAGVNDDVMEVIRMAGFDHVLEICTTEGEALNKFGD